MCWMCHEQEESAYHLCYGCGKTFEKSELQVYDVFKEWGQLIEWIEHHHRVVMFCKECVRGMNAYRESIRAQASETEPYVWYHYGSRFKDTKHGNIPVGIHCAATQMTHGLRCSKQVYGYDATEEILQGFTYRDDQGHRIQRLTLEDVGEKVICDKCWLPLWQCNAREVTR